jgi:hypothetical protein
VNRYCQREEKEGIKVTLDNERDMTVATVKKGKSKNIPQKMACMKAGHNDSSYFASTG